MKKKTVAIVGTNGVPANYGGFETLAENLVIELSDKVDITVYCSKKQKQKLRTFCGAKLINVPLSGNGYQSMLYDTLTLIHAFFTHEIVLYLGPGVGFMLFFNKIFRKKLIVNYGGLNEWEREKLSPFIKKLGYISHKSATKYALYNIADNHVLGDSIEKRFNIEPIVIKYGGDHVSKIKITQEYINEFPFLKEKYYVSVSRAQIDNNLHLVLDAFKQMPDKKIVLISNYHSSDYGKKLLIDYNGISNIVMLNAIYNKDKLNCIRSNAVMYIHSHSYCGTAPSLVEAICLELPIVCYDVPQNRETMNNGSLYFKSSSDLKMIIDNLYPELDELKSISIALKSEYSWRKISKQYLDLFEK